MSQHPEPHERFVERWAEIYFSKFQKEGQLPAARWLHRTLPKEWHRAVKVQVVERFGREQS